MPILFLPCSKCRASKPSSKFYYDKKSQTFNRYCRKCQCQVSVKSRRKAADLDPMIRLYRSTKSSAAYRGLVHQIGVADMPCPTHCPIMGIKLSYLRVSRAESRSTRIPDNAATVDRIDSSKGYIPGNMQTISWIANRIKGCRSREQLIAFSKGILRLFGEEQS